jgi:hypothetical protein
MIALISAATVAGKAAGKEFAIESANSVVLAVGRAVATFHRYFGGGRSTASSRSGSVARSGRGNGGSDRNGRNGGKA